MRDVECPYCGHRNDVDACDYHEPEEPYEYACGVCGKNFVLYVVIDITYSGHKADCLNGAEHTWMRPNTKYAWVNCLSCGETRRQTEEEKAQWERN